MFEYLNDDSKVVNLFDNEITFGIGGIHSTYSENIVTRSSQEPNAVFYLQAALQYLLIQCLWQIYRI